MDNDKMLKMITKELKENANKVFPNNDAIGIKEYDGIKVAKGDMNSGLGYNPNTIYCFGNSLKGKHCNICRDKIKCKENTISFLKEESL